MKTISVSSQFDETLNIEKQVQEASFTKTNKMHNPISNTRGSNTRVQERDDSLKSIKKQRLIGGFQMLEGDVLLAFRLEGYVEQRHAELKQMVVEDEARYGFLEGKGDS